MTSLAYHKFRTRVLCRKSHNGLQKGGKMETCGVGRVRWYRMYGALSRAIMVYKKVGRLETCGVGITSGVWDSEQEEP